MNNPGVDIPDGMEVLVVDGLTIHRWPETAATAPAPKRHISPLAFRRRFTLQERAAIEWAAVDRPGQPDTQRMQAAALRATLKDQEQARFIDLGDPDVAAGVQTMEAAGLLRPGRALVILDAPIEPKELP